MIPASVNMMIAGNKRPVDIQFVDEEYAASGSGASFSGVNIGAAASDRIIVVCIQCTNNTGSGFATTTVVSVTIDGNPMTRIVEAGVGNRNGGIFYLAVPSGTTATIATDRGTNATHKISVYAVYGAVGVTDSAVVNLTSGAVDVDVEAGGGVIAMGCTQGGGTPTYTWVGVNEDVDTTISVGSFGSGHDDNLAAAAPRTVTVVPSSSIGGVAAAASFR